MPRFPSQPRLYRVCDNEQPRRNWVVFREIKAPKPFPRFQFIPPGMFDTSRGMGGVFQTRPRYQRVVCSRCHRFDSDKIFRAGFDEDVTIRFRDDFATTNDRLFLISQRMLEVLRKGKVGGFEVTPVGKEGWHALNVTLRVDSDPGAYHEAGARCRPFAGCARKARVAGLIELLSEMNGPRCAPTSSLTTRSLMVGPSRFQTGISCAHARRGSAAEGERHPKGHASIGSWTAEEKRTRYRREVRPNDILNWYPPKRIIYSLHETA